jgi:hypothetical protein
MNTLVVFHRRHSPFPLFCDVAARLFFVSGEETEYLYVIRLVSQYNLELFCRRFILRIQFIY